MYTVATKKVKKAVKMTKAAKAVKTTQAPAKVINRDITETIRSSYQAELKVQTQTVQSLKKSLKTLASQLSKAISKRRVLKKKKIIALKKAGINPKGALKKQVEQAKTDYQSAMDEVKMLQQSLEQARQDMKMVKEQMKKLAAIIRSVVKMEKRWNKEIAAKFRAKTAKKKTAKKKDAAATTASKSSRRGRPAKAKVMAEVEQQPAAEETPAIEA